MQLLKSFRARLSSLLAIQSSRLGSMTSMVHATGDKGEADVKVLFDTGASHSFVLRSVAEKLTTIVKLPRPYSITLGDGGKISIVDQAVLNIAAAGQDIIDTFLVLDSGVEDVVLGESTMRKFGLKIDLEHSAVYSTLKVSNSTEAEMKDFLKKLFARLGIQAPEDTAEDKAIELIAANMSAQKAAAEKPSAGILKTVLAVLELPETATESEVRGTLLALKAPGNVVAQKDYDELKARLSVMEIDSAVTGAVADGKLYPHEKETWLKDLKEGKEQLATFSAMIGRRGKVVPLGQKLPDKKDDNGAGHIDDASLAIMKQMGVSKETFLKYNPPPS